MSSFILLMILIEGWWTFGHRSVSPGFATSSSPCESLREKTWPKAPIKMEIDGDRWLHWALTSLWPNPLYKNGVIWCVYYSYILKGHLISKFAFNGGLISRRYIYVYKYGYITMQGARCERPGIEWPPRRQCKQSAGVPLGSGQGRVAAPKSWKAQFFRLMWGKPS